MAVETSRGSGASALSQLTGDEEEDILDSTEEQEELEVRQDRDAEPPKVILDRLLGWIDNQNIARDIDQDILRDLGMLVVREYEIDEQSRSEWKDEAQKALDFATQTAQPKQYPWPDSSNVIFPLITSAAMRSVMLSAFSYCERARKMASLASVAANKSRQTFLSVRRPALAASGR